MTAKSQTLEEFVENYIQNKAKSNTKQSYADWIISNGISAEEIYSSGIRDINLDYAKARSEYGPNAERLAELGLNSSGYSDYLSGKAYSEMQKSKSEARNDYAKAATKNTVGYQEYLRKYAEKENESYEKIVNEITDRGIIDYSTAYNYAVGAGLSESMAKAAAKTASDISLAKLKESIVNTVLSQQLTASQAKKYALELGLSEEDAEAIAKYASAANEYVSTEKYTDANYLDSLREKAQTKNEIPKISTERKELK